MATSYRMGLVGVSGQDCDRLRQRLEAVVYSGGGTRNFDVARPPADEFEAQLTDAKSHMEVALRPWLTTPTLSELLLVRKLLVLARRRVEHVIMALRRRHPSGYGKIAVYAHLPMALNQEPHSWMERLSSAIGGTTSVCYWFIGRSVESHRQSHIRILAWASRR
jgi:hypothetical protein